MDSLQGSARWHYGGGDSSTLGPNRPNKRIKTSRARASPLQPVARLVRSPFDTLGSLAETLGFGSNNADTSERQAAEEQEKQIWTLRLRGAKTRAEWDTAALELDRLAHSDQWKDEDESEDYDVDLVKTRLERLRDAHRRGDVLDMRFQVRTALTRDLGGMGNVMLYKKSRIGTKALVEQHIDTVLETIDTIVDTSGLEPRAVHDQVKFARQAFGRSALLLSGGGTLGMNHIGVVKALFEAGMLPRIVSGASAGSIVSAVLATKTDAELPQVLEDFCHGELDVFEKAEEGHSPLKMAQRFVRDRALYDIGNLTRVMRNLLGDMTFQEAYNRTQRILSICVSSAEVWEMTQLLNYITAPHVIIWSAVAASCSVPLIYNPAELQCKNPTTGAIKSWNEDASKWIDGSVDNDLPMTRLAVMFNVNHFIVSQVNPHVVPFLAKEEDEVPPEISRSMTAIAPGPSWMHTVANLAKGEALHRMHVLADLGVFPNAMTKIRSVLGQRYAGDITIIPEVTYAQFPSVLTNPTTAFMVQAMINGERATWPKLSRIRNHLAVELKLDEAVSKLRTRVAFSPSQVDLRMNTFAPPTATRRLDRAKRQNKDTFTGMTKAGVPHQVSGGQTAHGPSTSTFASPLGITLAPNAPGQPPIDQLSSAHEIQSQRSTSSPTRYSEDDDSDGVLSDTSTTLPSPPPPPSSHDPRNPIKRPFSSASRLVAPNIDPRRSRGGESPSSLVSSVSPTATLAMTPRSLETTDGGLCHAGMKPLPSARPAVETLGMAEKIGGTKEFGVGGLRISLPGVSRKHVRSLSTGLRGLRPPDKL